jgi:hypothetical protein
VAGIPSIRGIDNAAVPRQLEKTASVKFERLRVLLCRKDCSVAASCGLLSQ